jgi:DNA-binding FadR family transcriptional regulator
VLQRLVTDDLRCLNEAVAHSGEVNSDFFKLDVEMIEVLSQMAGNPAIRLFLTILYQFGGHTSLKLFDHHPARVSLWREIRMWMLKAIISGDVDLAALYAQRRAAILMEWIEDDDDGQYLCNVLQQTV